MAVVVPNINDALIDASFAGQSDEVKKLVKAGADINYISPDLNYVYVPTALHQAIFHKDMELIRFLVENGAETNIATNACSPPLHWAVSAESEQLVQYLLDNGASPNKVSLGWNVTPLMKAVTQNSLEIVSILVTLGANVLAINKCGLSAFDIAIKNGNAKIFEFLARCLVSGQTSLNP